MKLQGAEKILSVPCPKCKVDADQECKVWHVNGTEMDAYNGRFHSERVKLASVFIIHSVSCKES